MFNVCPGCGDYRPDREVRASEGVAVCDCGDVQAFQAGPLLIVGGASATGKSTLLNHVGRRSLPVVPLDGDILWREDYVDRVDQYADLALRLARNVGMAGKPVLLFAAGLVVPTHVEASVERRYFSSIHRLALVCNEETLVERLRNRPAWRRSAEPKALAAQLDFDRALRRLAVPESIELLDTSSLSVDEAAEGLLAWVQRCLKSVT